jgi:cephalosporin hydroxylase
MNVNKFNEEIFGDLEKMEKDPEMSALSNQWLRKANTHRYSYHFNFLGRPIIQYPQDMIAVQELIWKVKPDLIIETGVAHGGSLILSAASLALLDLNEAVQQGKTLDPLNSKRLVIGIDIDIREFNRKEIENHFLFSRIKLIQGSSTDTKIVSKIKELSKSYKTVMVLLDSNHTKDHVLDELLAYTPIVTQNSYCIVFDTVIEDLPNENWVDRSWGLGNNPKIAVHEFLKFNSGFEIDKDIQNRLQITVAPDGYLIRRYL